MRMRRVYDAVDPDDGQRVLVDRLWPRGIAKSDPRVGRWLKDVAPSTELRHWYAHDPAKFDQFEQRFRAELADGPAAAALDELQRMADKGPLTLVTATKDIELSHLVVLTRIMEGG
jgi:uncharacterized protein YeaO (DUF488 family)